MNQNSLHCQSHVFGSSKHCYINPSPPFFLQRYNIPESPNRLKTRIRVGHVRVGFWTSTPNNRAHIYMSVAIRLEKKFICESCMCQEVSTSAHVRCSRCAFGHMGKMLHFLTTRETPRQLMFVDNAIVLLRLNGSQETTHVMCCNWFQVVHPSLTDSFPFPHSTPAEPSPTAP